MKARSVVALIESAYSVVPSTREWLENLAKASAVALESTRGAIIFQYDVEAGDWVRPGAVALHGLPPEFVQDFFNRHDVPPAVARGMAQEFKSARLRTFRALAERLGVGEYLGRSLDRHGIGDLVCINGLDPSGHGCMICVADQTNHAEAILSPNGKVEHASGPAEPASAREALQKALARIDAARSEKDDAGQSVELWRGLVAGRWSLVEHFERDGRRYFLAQKNDPILAEDRALTRRERQVVGYAELGHSNKLIAYELGLSTSTVSALLSKAKTKLGTRAK